MSVKTGQRQPQAAVRRPQPTTKARIAYFLVGLALALVIAVLFLALEWSKAEMIMAAAGFTFVYVAVATPILFLRSGR